MRIRKLPITDSDITVYNLDYYGLGDVDIFLDEEQLIGERVNCIFRTKDLIKFDDEKCFDITFAILCNNCGIKNSHTSFLKGLSIGQIIPVQFNGDINPTMPMEWVRSQFWLLEE